MSDSTDNSSSSAQPAPFPIELCHEREVNLYRSNNDNVFRVGKYIVRVDTTGLVVLNKAFAADAQKCVLTDAIALCKGFPRDSNTFAYLHNFDQAGIEKCFCFSVEFVGPLLSIEKHNEKGWSSKWHLIEFETSKQALIKAEFVRGLNE